MSELVDRIVGVTTLNRSTLIITAAAALAAGAFFWPAGSKPMPQTTHAADAANTAQVIAGPNGKQATAVGLDKAAAILGKHLPTGLGVAVGHVEGSSREYLPNIDSPSFKSIDFHARSGPSKTFGHADHTARVIYGQAGLAPGVKAVHLYSASHWLSRGYLNTGSPLPPRKEPARIYTHSWISAEKRAAPEILRRIDYAVDHDGVIMCVGVNNGRTSAVPALLSSAYNVIAVGSDSGASSGGYTLIEGEGRCKPDIVAPGGKTSFATPVVTACVARLLEAADSLNSVAKQAARPEVIKAVLLAGADKPWNWTPEPGKPLDEHLGAGVLRFDRSLAILQTPPVGTRKPDIEAGWELALIQQAQTQSYRMHADQPLAELSIVLTWHRRIAGSVTRELLTSKPRWNDAPRLANLDLRLLHTDDAGQTRILRQSISTSDNVEHIYLKDTPAGTYRIEIVRHDDDYDEPWMFALAWRGE